MAAWGDVFNRADGDAGTDWVDSSTAVAGRLQITSNQIGSSSTSYREMIYGARVPRTPDYLVTMRHAVDGTASNVWQLWGRYTGLGATKCGYRLEVSVSAGTYRLLEVTNDTDVELIAATSWSLATGKDFGLLFINDSVYPWLQGARVQRVQGLKWRAPGTGGIGIYNPNQDMFGDNFQIQEIDYAQRQLLLPWLRDHGDSDFKSELVLKRWF